MASGGNKPRTFGGVKTASGGKSPASSLPKQTGRTFGTVKPPERGDDLAEPLALVRRALRRCAAQAEAVVRDILKDSDSITVHPTVIWGDEHGPQDWKCPHNCKPVKLASCWTHAEGCEYWSEYERGAIQLEGAGSRPGVAGDVEADPPPPSAGDGDCPF